MYVGVGIGAGILVVWFLVSAYINNVEQAPYTVVEKRNGYEIRLYAPHLAIEVRSDGPFDTALNDGFRILAAYIFGNNTQNTSIAMTAPVRAEKNTGEKIAMTAPVIAAKSEDAYRVQFVVPSSYTRETLPTPRDERIRIIEQPEERVAALRFGWYFNNARVEQKTKELLNALARDGIQTIGEPRFAGYNDPWAFPLLIRNEILVPIAESKK